ncbi:hypothetical protein [Nocardioides sp. T2.26MG-1]|uniref:hypothetical protein n=1 Tax=Nocardioides sp. T2.26MG-1 TaxID=3041166 RepID=UPI0025426526|nr:hypothetical protein [Nocardioides sp. T2.26MG-1]
MSAAPGGGIRTAAAGACCAVASLAYSGAVSLFALLAFVIPAVVVVIVLTAAAARLSVQLAAASGLAAALAVAEVVNLVSGTGHGPAARSTFAAATFTALAVAAVRGPAPALFTAGVVGVVGGALGLGAGAEVAPVAVATAVVTTIALAVVEGQSRRWTGRAPHLIAVVTFAVLIGGLSAAIALQADRRLEGEPAVLAPGAVDQSIQPPSVLGDPDPRPTPSRAPADSTAEVDTPPTDSGAPLRAIWLTVLAALLSALVAATLRVAWVALAWRRLRRRLRRGTETEQIAGAWIWSTRRLRAAGFALPRSLPVDAAASGQRIAALPRTLRQPLRQIASSTVSAVYAPTGVQPRDVPTTWSAADDVARSAVKGLPAGRRLAFAVRSIDSTPSHPAAPVTEESSS